jgi:hypothetical protein
LDPPADQIVETKVSTVLKILNVFAGCPVSDNSIFFSGLLNMFRVLNQKLMLCDIAQKNYR